MHRFLVPAGACRADRVELDAEESRHAALVLRLGVGDEVELLDGTGGRFPARVMEVSKRRLSVSVMERPMVIPRSGEVWLLAALTKGKAWDATVQKATELGVAVIAPIQADRSVVRVAADEREAKAADWLRTAGEAAKQCGTAWLPRILPPLPLAEALAALGQPSLGLVAALTPETAEVRTWWQRRTDASEMLRTVALAVGPEGDFSPFEYAQLAEQGYLPITLGPLVLRADTAAIAGLALIQHEFRLASAS